MENNENKTADQLDAEGMKKNNFSKSNALAKKKKEAKARKAKMNQELIELGHADLVAPEVKRGPNHAPSEAELRLIDIKRKHWLQFVWALPFRIFEKITGEIPPVPPSGTFAVNGWPKTSITPWDYVLNSMGYVQPFPKKEHNIAYAVIAEFYTLAGISGVGGKKDHPMKKMETPEKKGDIHWQELLPYADALIAKWTKKDEFLDLSFPNAMRYARLEMRLSQGEVADMVGYNFLAVSRWERGEYQPSPQAIYELANNIPSLKRWFRYHPDWVKEHGGVI